jgi:lysophospholipid acyltransferase
MDCTGSHLIEFNTRLLLLTEKQSYRHILLRFF